MQRLSHADRTFFTLKRENGHLHAIIIAQYNETGKTLSHQGPSPRLPPPPASRFSSHEVAPDNYAIHERGLSVTASPPALIAANAPGHGIIRLKSHTHMRCSRILHTFYITYMGPLKWVSHFRTHTYMDTCYVVRMRTMQDVARRDWSFNSARRLWWEEDTRHASGKLATTDKSQS